MNNYKEYLDEKQYQKSNSKVKMGGRIAIIIGILMILCGIFVIKVPDMGEEGWFGASSGRMFLIGIGFFVTIVGCMVRFIIANQRNIMAYQMQQMRPIVQEGSEKMAPTAGKVAKEIAKGVKEGLEDEDK